jgi:hypothetical protein
MGDRKGALGAAVTALAGIPLFYRVDFIGFIRFQNATRCEAAPAPAFWGGSLTRAAISSRKRLT